MSSPYLLLIIIVLIFMMWFHLIYLIDRLEKRGKKLHQNSFGGYKKHILYSAPIPTDEERKQYLSYIKENPFGMKFQDWKDNQARKEVNNV